MADQLPNFAPTPGGRWARGWHEYSNYQVVHENHIQALLNESVITRDTTRFVETVDANGQLLAVNLLGRIVTSGGAIVIVNKWLASSAMH